MSRREKEQIFKDKNKKKTSIFLLDIHFSLFQFRAYAEQTNALNRMRGMLEDENNQKRAQMMKDL